MSLVGVLQLHSDLKCNKFYPSDNINVAASKSIIGDTALNINCGGAGTLNLGTSGDTVNISGTINNVETNNLKVDNTSIILNANASGSGTARNVAINIRDNG